MQPCPGTKSGTVTSATPADPSPASAPASRASPPNTARTSEVPPASHENLSKRATKRAKIGEGPSASEAQSSENTEAKAKVASPTKNRNYEAEVTRRVEMIQKFVNSHSQKEARTKARAWFNHQTPEILKMTCQEFKRMKDAVLASVSPDDGGPGMRFGTDPLENKWKWEVEVVQRKALGKPIPVLRENVKSDLTVANELLVTKVYTNSSPHSAKGFLFLPRPGDRSFEGGGNCGAYSFVLFDLGVSSNVVYEPSKYCIPVLRQNSDILTACGFTMKVVQKGLSTASGPFNLDDHTHCRSCGGSARSALSGNTTCTHGEVYGIELDSFGDALRMHSPIEVCKLDIEKAEVAILEMKWDWGSTRILHIEFSIVAVRREWDRKPSNPKGWGWTRLANILERLAEAGFSHVFLPSWLWDPDAWVYTDHKAEQNRKFAADPILMFYRMSADPRAFQAPSVAQTYEHDWRNYRAVMEHICKAGRTP